MRIINREEQSQSEVAFSFAQNLTVPKYKI